MLAERNAAPSEAMTKLMLPSLQGKRPRLLLAEDSPPVRVVTAAMLKGMGCDVEPVSHGEEALNCAVSRRFDVIVLDIEMPVMDGITAARSIRNLGGASGQTPLMALSAFLADAMQQASWSEAFDIALPKPANRNELHRAVTAALKWPSFPAAKARVEAEPAVCTEALKGLQRGLSRETWAELCIIACRDIADCMASMMRGRPDELRVNAQKLRALGKTFALPRLARLAIEIERSLESDTAGELLVMLGPVAQASAHSLRNG
jgi:CheY-like chemotaxis protein